MAEGGSSVCPAVSVRVTGQIKEPLIEKRRVLSPGGRVPPSFIHQVIIIGLDKF